MPSATYLKNKQNIFLWRERHPEDWSRTHARQNKTYYHRHKEHIQRMTRLRASYNREAKVFREILFPI